MAIVTGIFIVMMFMLGLSMITFSIWCGLATYRSQDGKISKLMDFVLDGCVFAAGLCCIAFGVCLISFVLRVL